MTDIFQTHIDEQAYAVQILREAFPDMDEQGLEGNGPILRSDSYLRGRWLSAEEIRTMALAEPPGWPPNHTDRYQVR